MSLESEQAIIASCIDSAQSYDTVSQTLCAGDFTDDRMRLLFELIAKIREAGRTPDAVTISVILGKSQRWAQTGLDDPAAFVNGLAEYSRTYKAVTDYTRIVKAASVGRQLVDCCASIYALTQDTSLDPEQMLSMASQLIPVTDATGDIVTYKEAAMAALESMQRRMEGEKLGVPTGLAGLDDLIMGFEKGTLNILGGRPSHGKSLYGMDFAHAAAAVGPVQIYSLEMTAANLAMRGLANLGTVDFGRLRDAKIDDHMSGALAMAIKKIKNMPITIDDRGGITVDQLRSRARITARREKPVLIVADYLQLLGGVGDNRTGQVGYVSRSLKNLAKELDVPVLCLAQVNRAVESRPDKRPMSSDLRDSGEIEQDADLIMFTYLHEKYEPDTQRKGVGELIIRKQRNGPTGTVFTEFQGRYQRFVEYTSEPPPEQSEKDTPKAGRGMSDAVGGAVAAKSNERF